MPIVTKPYQDFVNNIDVVDAGKINAQINTLYNAINGGLDSANIPSLVDGANRQSLINGNFDIAQRGTSFTNPANSTFTADRWKTINGADVGTFPTTITHSLQALTPGDITNSYNYYRVSPNGAGTTGAGQYYIFLQSVENGTRFLAGLGKKVTVSFWARSSIAGKRIAAALDQTYGTGGSPSAAENINGTTFTLTSTWTKYTFTFTTNTLVGKTFGTNNDDSLILNFWFAWGTTYLSRVGAGTAETFGGSGTIDIAQVQVNAGVQALPFQPKSFADELALCRRYCFVLTDETNQQAVIGYGFAGTTTIALIGVSLPVQMRIQPTLSATATDFILQDGATTTTLTAISIQPGQNGRSALTIRATVAAGLTQFRPYSLTAVAISKLLILDAEL